MKITVNGIVFILRDDGYRVYAAREGEAEEGVVFEYKHSDHPFAYEIVQSLLAKGTN